MNSHRSLPVRDLCLDVRSCFFFVKEDTVIMSLGCHLIDIYTNTFPFTQLITLQSMNKAMFKKTYRSNLI